MLFFTVIGGVLPITVHSQDSTQRVSAVTGSPVYPLLIRNEHGPVAQIVINTEKDVEAKLESLTFSLQGTDELTDIAELRLFASGDQGEFQAKTQIGDATLPTAEVVFRCDLPLKPGKNVLWLSSRLNDSADLMRHIAATCTSIGTSLGQLVPKDLTPGRRHSIGIALRKHNDDGVHTYRIPALTTSSKGSLLVVYDMRRRMGRDLQEDIDIGLSRSTNGGKTWDAVRVIMDMGEYGGLPQGQNGCSDPGIIVDHQTGEIFCFAVWMNGKPGKHQWNGDGSEPGFEIGKSAQMLMVRSKDDGLTWSKPENLTRKLKKEAWWLFAPAPQQGIQLADGMLVMPSQGRDEQGKEFSTIMTSRDHGSNWSVGTPAYIGGSECQAVQLTNGAIMLNMRNEYERYRAVFTTSDFGQTWTPHPSDRKALIEPNCNGSLVQLDVSIDGKSKRILLFSNPHTQKGRTHQTIQASFDEGMTWPESHHRLLDEGRGAGYPSLTRIDDRHVGIVYEGSQSQLVFQKFTIDELIRR